MGTVFSFIFKNKRLVLHGIIKNEKDSKFSFVFCLIIYQFLLIVRLQKFKKIWFFCQALNKSLVIYKQNQL